MSNELDLRDYVRIIRKRLWMIVAIVVAACLLAGAFSMYFQKPVYEASTKIIVNQTASQAMLQQLDLNQINSNIRMIDTYKEIIKTPAILDKVVERYPQFGLTTEQLADKVKVSSVNNTQVMTLAVQDLSYRQAAEIVNAVSLIFQQEIPTLFNIENVSILNEAKVDATPDPVSPNIPLNIAISFVVALMLGIGVSFLLEFLDDTVKTEEDVQRYLGLPTLGVITRMDQEDIKTASTKASSQSYKKAGELERVTIGK
ncbi:YveK family protein [Paenibacillus sp. SYP-B4298]|uniref:YveK family protein n=1 Tax=Paenibacillus sp. SYP-B4298 TaxID=2996034 RepID=UPI0022DE4DA1|nr:Wzz/FepE/Etk N-terminal domain-containing protein [Paenibacillus sp. SYP-B4298]